MNVNGYYVQTLADMKHAIEIQEILTQIDQSNFEEIKNILINSHLNENKDGFRIILSSMNFIMQSRPQNTEIYLKMIQYFLPKIRDYYTKEEQIKIFLLNEVALHEINIEEHDVSCYDHFPDNYVRPFAYIPRPLSEDPIEKSIRKDDFEEFGKLISLSNKSLDSLVNCPSTNQIEYIIDDEEHDLISYAALYGAINIFKFLWLQLKEKGNNAFSEFLPVYAIAGGNYEIIHFFDDRMDENCLIAAIRFFRFEIIKYLLNTYDIKLTNPLTYCIQSFNFKAFCYFYDINELNKDNFFMKDVFCAVNCNNTFILKYLLDVVKLDITQSRGNINILHEAASSDNPDVLNFLLTERKLFDVNCRGDGEMTSLHFAAYGNCLNAAMFLVNVPGIELNARDCDQATPLHWAVTSHNFDVFKFLLSVEGVDIQARNKLGLNILHISCYDETLYIIDYILKNKLIDIEQKDGSGEIVTHHAARYGLSIVFDLLIKLQIPKELYWIKNGFTFILI